MTRISCTDDTCHAVFECCQEGQHGSGFVSRGPVHLCMPPSEWQHSGGGCFHCPRHSVWLDYRDEAWDAWKARGIELSDLNWYPVHEKDPTPAPVCPTCGQRCDHSLDYQQEAGDGYTSSHFLCYPCAAVYLPDGSLVKRWDHASQSVTTEPYPEGTMVCALCGSTDDVRIKSHSSTYARQGQKTIEYQLQRAECGACRPLSTADGVPFPEED